MKNQSKKNPLSTILICHAVLLIVLCAVPLSLAEAQDLPSSIQNKYLGHITGTVTTTKGKPIRGALVEAFAVTGRKVQEQPTGFAFSDQSGKFSLDLTVGTYALKIKAPKFREKEFTRINVTSADEIKMPIRLLADVPILMDELRVIAKVKKTSEKAQLAQRKESTNVVENIGSETIAKIPESDVSGILTRMPGVVMSEGKYMQARGMTKRYNNTTLNGCVLPTTRPNEKLTPLDLFPGGIVDSISVAKTFTPDLPGNFSGGLCQIKTKAIPDRLFAKISFTTSFNTETTRERYLTYKGGSKDWLGYDDGTRDLPDIIPDDQVRRQGQFGGAGFLPRDLERFGESFDNNWNTTTNHAPLNTDYTFSLGNRFGKLGGIFSVYYKSEIKTPGDEQRNIYTSTGNGGVRIDSSYDFNRSMQYIKEGSILNLGLEISPDHTIYFKNFYNRNTTDEARMYEGFNSDKSDNIMVTRLRYIEEEIYAGQITGDHAIESLLQSKITWRYNYSIGNMYDPDMRENVYEYNSAFREYFLATDQEALLRMFTEQEEDMHEGAIDWETTMPSIWTWLETKLKFGALHSHRKREFWSRRFAFLQRDMSRIDTTQDPETILRPENINPYEIEIGETTRPTDTYDAEEDITAYYGMLDFTLFDRLQIFGGIRFERDDTNVLTYDLFNPTSTVATTLKDDKVMPSINLKYSLMKDMNFRLSYSETVSRPEFHELAPFEFTDVVGGAAVKGNPDLQIAEIKNYDFRWEWFFNDEDVVSISLFYKDITNAIEPTLQATTQLRSSFVNADEAWLKGYELELQKNLGFISPWLRHFSIMANYIYADSETKIKPKTGFVPTTSTRPMVGQPENMMNLTLEYDNPAWGFMARAMYRYTDTRIQEIGGLGLPDVILDEEQTVDVVLVKKFFEKFELRLVGQNLWAEDKTYLQGGQIYHRYDEGRTFKVGLSYTW